MILIHSVLSVDIYHVYGFILSPALIINIWMSSLIFCSNGVKNCNIHLTSFRVSILEDVLTKYCSLSQIQSFLAGVPFIVVGFR